MPWEITDKFIRSGHTDSSDFQAGSFRTIDISKPDKIKAVIGKKKGETTTSILSYLFDVDKWTLAKAKEWFETHKASEFSFLPSSPFTDESRIIYRFCSPFLLKEDGDWVQILRTGQWKSPKYGKFKVTPETLQEMKENFDSDIRGQKILLDVEHEPKNGSIGEIQALKIQDNSLWAKATWTTEGKELKDSRKYPYISPEFAPVYEDAETGQKAKNVLLGVAVTTRPFIKHMAPVVSLSEDMEGGNMDLLISLNEKIKTLNLMDHYSPEGIACDKIGNSIMHTMDSFRSLLEAVVYNEDLDVTQKLTQAKKILISLPDQIISMISIGLQTMEMSEEEADFLSECWGERLKLMETGMAKIDISSLKAALKSHGIKPEDIEKMLAIMKGPVKSSEEEVLDAFDLAVKNFSDLMGQFSEHLKNVGGKNYVITNMKDLMQKLSDLSVTIKKRREKPVATKANETEEKEGKEVLVPAEVKLSEDQVKTLTEQIREQVAADIAKQYEEKVKALSEEHQAAMQAVEAYKRDHKLRDLEEQIKAFKCTEISDGVKRQIAPAGIAVLQEVMLELSEETGKKLTEMLAKGIPMVALGELGSGAEVLGSVDDDQKVIALAEHKRKENPALPYKQHMLAARKELGVSRKKQAVGGEE